MKSLKQKPFNRLIQIFTIWAILSCSTLTAQSYVPNQLIIKTSQSPASNVYSTSLLKTLESLNYTEIKSLEKTINTPLQSTLSSLSSTYLITFENNIPLDLAETTLKKQPEIKWAHKNFLLYPQHTPNDPLISQQPYLDLISAKNAWDISTGNKTITVAVVDTGLAYSHPDLEGKIWNNPKIIDGIDFDKNPYAQDRIGWDFGDNDNDPFDGDNHGTAVSGLIVAKTNNNIGIASVGYNTTIMPIKVMNSNGNIPTDKVVEALPYILNHDVKLINISLGAVLPDDQENKALEEAISSAIDKGAIIVVAAGNRSGSNAAFDIDEANFVPASYPNVITVSGTDENGNYDDSFSLFGNSVDITAPGKNILSLTYDDNKTPAHSYQTFTGTSFSAPLVSGAIALFLEVNPDATRETITNALHASATDKGTTGKDKYHGYGLLNVHTLISPQPIVTFLNKNSSFFSSNQPITISIIDPLGINEKTISVTIFGADIESKTYHLPHPGLSFSNSELTISPTILDTLPSGTPLTFKVSATNTSENKTEKTLTLTQSSTLKLFGPNGKNSRLLNVPNPFNPQKETTAFHFEITQSADIIVTIYSLQLKKIKTLYKNNLPTGYNKLITWNGRDEFGRIIPNGTYFYTIKAVSQGNTKIKRGKLTILQ